jgi:hypothetical protein
MTSIFSRPPIRFADDFSELDRERFMEEYLQEERELSKIISGLIALKANRRYSEETMQTLLEVWERCQDNLRLRADFEQTSNPQFADEILEGVRKSDEWRDDMRDLARKELLRRKQNGTS